eukprot:6189270-Pleurochrysis_carterae.AAC.4
MRFPVDRWAPGEKEQRIQESRALVVGCAHSVSTGITPDWINLQHICRAFSTDWRCAMGATRASRAQLRHHGRGGSLSLTK